MMLIPSFILWDVGYSVYTYGSLFIIALVIWHVKRSHRGLRLGPNKSCAKCFRRIKQKPSDRTTRAKRTSKEEAEKLQKLLSIMKSQGWLPQEGSVRRLLCPDPSCPICNAMALEIQQLLGVEDKKIASSPLRTSRTFSCLEALSPSKVMVDQSSELSSQYSRDISSTSRFTQSQSTDQKSTQSATPSTGGDAVLQCYHSEPQPQQEPQGSNAFQDASGLSSSSMDGPGVPANQQKKRKKTKKLVLKNQGPPEAELENKMTFFSHWVNPEVKCDRPEEPIVLKSETGAKPETGETKKSHSSAKDRAERPSVEKPINDLKAKSLRVKRNI
ncbi:protein FAM205C isoform X2 [Apodemus sylvaticus]|uniref:protein FAM205C isoform X2 n=1 Tax=Apodemus sylvaticus TaxID=10129 RepID=UPI0022443542|nr:protein FAM205C isoform X2 [Apodemus sylvaticus]